MTETVILDNGDATTTVVTPTPQPDIILDEQDSRPEFAENVPEIFVIDKIGPRGEPGPIGATGSTGPAGPQGVKGNPGLDGTGVSYRFVQMTPAMQWDVTHNLTKAYPEVSVILSDGSRVEADVEFVDSLHLTILFTAAVSGEAYLT